jgi:P27 family predicted phage terminase small subunit
MKGRKAKPKALLKLVGTYRQDKHGNCPDPPATHATCPEWLNARAKAYWPQIAEMLALLRLNSSHYELSVALLCDALADFIRISEICVDASPLSVGHNGNGVQNPVFRLKNAAWDRLLKACREFGMSPAALRGISTSDRGPVDTLDQVLA